MSDHRAGQPAVPTTAQVGAFPTGFRWGAATAAFQIEGSTAADGRGESIWDAFCRRPGAVVDGDTGEPACDHYRRMPQDVQLLSDLGMGTYRFSVSWPRVRPDGGAAVNAAGLDFYSRLVDTLLENGIRPWVTLYHWDLPQVLEEAGGWTSRDTAMRFAEYATSLVQALGDRVATWTTLNEPWCSAFLGYAAGVHAPGRREPRAAVAAVHHLLLAHGLGMQVLRDHGVEEAGLTLNFTPVSAADPADPADADLVRRVDGQANRLFVEPVLLGAYPSDVVTDLEPFGLTEHVRDGDLASISTPLDVLGVNYYTTQVVQAAAAERDDERVDSAVGVTVGRLVDRGLPRTAMGWDVDPRGLTDLLVRLHTVYPAVPLVVTENGSAWTDVVSADGAVDDPERVGYLRDHLRACLAAIDEGVDLRGYLAWSLLDNFEWSFGYGKRFGIVHVDYDTQVRTVKTSARVLAEVARGNAL